MTRIRSCRTAQNVKLHEALTKAGVANELFTIPAGGHGNFKADERTKAYIKIREFLGKYKLMGTTN